jgi:hypothetical protein
MTRNIIHLLILFSLAAGSCSGSKDKLDKSKLIPEEKLVPILTEIYLTDGLLLTPTIRNWASSLDSLSLYYQTIENHGYSKEAFDYTIHFYFDKKPRQLIKIYDQVLGILSEMESIVTKEALIEEELKNNLWKGNTSYLLPDPSGNDSTEFETYIDIPGIYTFSFSLILFPDDQSLNPTVKAYTCDADSIDTGRKYYIETINYFKDGRPHRYTLNFKVPISKRIFLKGRLLDTGNISEKCEKHAIIYDISVKQSSGLI